MTLVPHLYFRSGCEEALRFYERVGLGAITSLERTHDGREILHAELVGPRVRLFAGEGSDAEPMKGCALLLSFDDVAEARATFDALSSGGRVTVPFDHEPWGVYGNFTDRFGVQWAVHAPGG